MKKKKPQVAVAQLGARMHYAVPRILHEAGMLAHFYTDICAVQGWPRLFEAIPSSLRPNGIKRLLARIPKNVPREQITAFNSFGWDYARRLRKAQSRTDQTKCFLWAGREFAQQCVHNGIHEADAVYVFRSAGLEVLKAARARGSKTILEQPIAARQVEERLLSSEQARHSTWVSEVDVDQYMSEYAEREKEEWKLADVILCGSEFVRDSIAQCNGPIERCRVVPYGVDFNVIPPSNSDRTRTNLRVLTVGSISLRKGAPYVLKAARKCSSFAEFRMVGGASIPEQARRELDAHVDLTGVVPRSEVRQHYEWADVFLLPSICEGSATVTYEALAAGLPVICTPNTGSIIRDGKDGFIVPVQNAEAIAEKVCKLSSNRRLLKDMSRSASSRYASGGTLKAYANRIHDVIRNVFN